MNRKVLFEGIFLLSMSLVGLAEAYRMISDRDPYIVHGAVEPGIYVLVLSLVLVGVSIAHLAVHRKEPSGLRLDTSPELRNRVLLIVALFALYIVLIPFVGYTISTLVFLLLEFRVMGVRSWRYDVALTVGLTVAFYFIFVEYCQVVFSRHALFQ